MQRYGRDMPLSRGNRNSTSRLRVYLSYREATGRPQPPPPPHHNPRVVLTMATRPGLARKSRVVLATRPAAGLARKSRVVLTTHPGLARKSRVVNGKILQLERGDMCMRARMYQLFSAIHRRHVGPTQDRAAGTAAPLNPADRESDEAQCICPDASLPAQLASCRWASASAGPGRARARPAKASALHEFKHEHRPRPAGPGGGQGNKAASSMARAQTAVER